MWERNRSLFESSFLHGLAPSGVGSSQGCAQRSRTFDNVDVGPCVKDYGDTLSITGMSGLLAAIA